MQTVYLGNTLINDVYLGSTRMEDVVTVPFPLPPVKDGLEVYLTTFTQQSYTSGSSTWNDISGNGRTFSLSNPKLLTSQSFNGLFLGVSNAVYSTATASYSNGLPWTFNTTGSFFYVFRQANDLGVTIDTVAALGSINDGTNNNNDFTNYQRHAISPSQPWDAAVYTNSGPFLQTNSENINDGAIHLVYSTWNSGPTVNSPIAIDRNAPQQGNVYTFTNTGSIRLSLGTNARLNQSDNANCAFFEVAYYSRRLTDTELTSSINYFCNRYSIA